MWVAAQPFSLASLPPWGLPAIIGGVLGFGLLLLVVAAIRKRRPKEVPCRSCGRIMLAEWTKCRFCGTATREMRAELEFVSGPLVGQSVGLDRDVTTIGSVAGNTVLLTDTGVSRKHV